MAEPCAIGIDLGGTYIKGAIVNEQGQIIHKNQVETGVSQGADRVITRISSLAQQLVDKSKLYDVEIQGIGIGAAGNLDTKKGMVIFSPNLFWHNVELTKPLANRLNLPVFLENDANTATLAEHWVGAGKDANNMMLVTLGTGVGGGIIINGKLYRGSTGTAGEIGHTIVLEGGPRCNCGQNGCLETLVAAPWLVKQAKELIACGYKSKLEVVNNLEAKDIYDFAWQGDRLALQIVEKAGYYLGLALANIINLLNPEIIVIGGGVSQAGNRLLEIIANEAKTLALKVPAVNTHLVLAKLGNEAGSIGAAKLVFCPIKAKYTGLS